ncbi:MAG: Ig-like domain-containing protein [Candidatus Kerfeldbacteria bacterium]
MELIQMQVKTKVSIEEKIIIAVMMATSLCLAAGIIIGMFSSRIDHVNQEISRCPSVNTDQWASSNIRLDIIDQSYKTVDMEECSGSIITLQGILQEVAYDDFDKNTAWSEFFLHTDDGVKYQLFFTSESEPGLISGTTMLVTGYDVGNNTLLIENIIDENEESKTGIAQLKSGERDSVLGEQRVLVIPANFQDTELPSITNAEIDQVVFGSINEYYQEVSFNQMNLSGETLLGLAEGWSTLPINHTCGFNEIYDATINLVDPDVDFTQYDHVMIVVPVESSCAWAGLSTIGKSPHPTDDGVTPFSIQVVRSVYMTYTSYYVPGHELGHGLGARHASFIDCGEEIITLDYENCELSEYGDWYDIMGRGFSGHFNSVHKEYMGWFNDTYQIHEASESGTFTLKPIETPVTGGAQEIKALKIPRTPGDYLYLEFRQPYGTDSDLSCSILGGALLHVNGREYGLVDPARSWLLDITPGDSGCPEILPELFSFTDPVTGTVVQVDEVFEDSGNPENSYMNVTVIIGKTDFDPPTALFTSPKMGTEVSGLVPLVVSASDLSGIEKVDFFRSGLVSLGTDAIVPYEGVFDSREVLNGLEFVQARVYDNAGAPYGAPNNSSFIFTNMIVNNNIMCGDVDNSGSINIADVTFLVSYLFTGGIAPYPYAAANVDLDTRVSVADLTYLVASLFLGGPDPCDPPAAYSPVGTDWTQGEYEAWYQENL